MIKRLTIFSVVVAVAITSGFFLPSQWLEPVFHYSGYYFMLIIFFLWGLFFIRIFDYSFLKHLRKHFPAFLIALVLMTLIFNISPPKFKILADETNLAGVSMAMHQNKTVSMPTDGFARDFIKFDYNQRVDPRPLLYPFIVSICHSLLGYSPFNSMVVNFIAGTTIILLMYIAIYLFFGRFLGYVAMIIMASFPVFIFWVTSCGFETINLCMIMITLTALILFLKFQEVKYAEFLFFSIVLLANCRYESIIFFFSLIFLSPVFLKKDMLQKYHLSVFFIPLFFLPLIWQRQINFLDASVRGNNGLEAAHQIFSITNLIDNLPQNIFVLTGLNPNFGFLPVIFLAAIAGLYLAGRKCLLNFRSISPINLAFGQYLVLSGLLLFLIYTSFYWGQFIKIIDNRLAMAMLPFIIFPAIYSFDQLLSNRPKTNKNALFFLFFLQMIYYWPVASEQVQVRHLTNHFVNERVTKYLYSHYNIKNEKILLISDRPSFFIIHKIGSIGIWSAAQNYEKIHQYANMYYDHTLVIQKCNPLNDKVLPHNQLQEDFHLQELKRINVGPKYYLRISKLTCMKK